MNENARKWVEALRSGDFEQARDRLRRGDQFCCLGVACELYRRETGEGTWNQYGFTLPDERTDEAVLPSPVANWLGLQSDGGGYGKGSRCLAADNDSGSTFDEIAATIESEPTGLFA